MQICTCLRNLIIALGAYVFTWLLIVFLSFIGNLGYYAYAFAVGDPAIGLGLQLRVIPAVGASVGLGLVTFLTTFKYNIDHLLLLDPETAAAHRLLPTPGWQRILLTSTEVFLLTLLLWEGRYLWTAFSLFAGVALGTAAVPRPAPARVAMPIALPPGLVVAPSVATAA